MIIARKFFELVRANPAYIYLLKIYKRNTRKRCEICSKRTIKQKDNEYCNF